MSCALRFLERRHRLAGREGQPGAYWNFQTGRAIDPQDRLLRHLLLPSGRSLAFLLGARLPTLICGCVGAVERNFIRQALRLGLIHWLTDSERANWGELHNAAARTYTTVGAFGAAQSQEQGTVH